MDSFIISFVIVRIAFIAGILCPRGDLVDLVVGGENHHHLQAAALKAFRAGRAFCSLDFPTN